MGKTGKTKHKSKKVKKDAAKGKYTLITHDYQIY